MRILSEYQKNYSNIKVIDQKNSGAACARNTGIQRAEGEYVFFLVPMIGYQIVMC